MLTFSHPWPHACIFCTPHTSSSWAFPEFWRMASLFLIGLPLWAHRIQPFLFCLNCYHSSSTFHYSRYSLPSSSTDVLFAVVFLVGLYFCILLLMCEWVSRRKWRWIYMYVFNVSHLVGYEFCNLIDDYFWVIAYFLSDVRPYIDKWNQSGNLNIILT